MKISLKKGKKYHILFSVAIIIVAIAIVSSSYLYYKTPKIKPAAETDPVALKFNYIVLNANSACYGIKTVMQMPDSGRIMGSCCGPMYEHTYEEQVKALKKYKNFDFIPTDPYDISVAQAKSLINDFKTIKLSPAQQKIYESAKKLSKEGGPCCCGDDFRDDTCWRWKVYGGVAKKLITEHNFNAEQVADVWDISDGCGGDHHVEEVHI